MGFLFPFFLVAGVLLAVPVLIHLFNLRKYKHVFFPDIRFLQQLKIVNKRSAQLQKKWLLAARVLFLACLILAFSKPYFQGAGGEGDADIRIIYVDNSMSMLARSGQESLLQQAKKKAKALLRSSPAEARFLVMENDRLAARVPVNKEEAEQMLDEIAPSSVPVSAERLFNAFRQVQENEKNERWSVFVFSDFQKSSFTPRQKPQGFPGTSFYFVPIQQRNLANLSIDTAWFLNPSLESNQENPLVVQVRASGKVEQGTLKLFVGDQTRSVVEIGQIENGRWQDTLQVRPDAGWQSITLALSDFPLTFDDTFRMATRPASSFSVLVVSDGVPEPHLQAALRSYANFTTEWKSAAEASASTLGKYSLVILQNVDQLPGTFADALQKELENGLSVLLFPGVQAQKESLNRMLRNWLPVSFADRDTGRYLVSALQEQHPFWNDLFVHIPKNVQLPIVQSRFPIRADINANQQTLMSFSDGTPFLAQYPVGKGKLFLNAATLDLRSSDYALSNLFLPTLYKMAIQSSGGIRPALFLHDPNPLWIKSAQFDERTIWHLKASDVEIVPRQQPSGAGTDLFFDQVHLAPGYYWLKQENGKDSLLLAFNHSRFESDIATATKNELENSFSALSITWLDDAWSGSSGEVGGGFWPAWKILILIALFWLFVETYFLYFEPKARKRVVAST